jgi:outer membrane cobalamin receptor
MIPGNRTSSVFAFDSGKNSGAERTAAPGCPIMKLHTPFTSMVCTLFASTLLFVSAPAAIYAAEIQGMVYDPTGKPIPGAQVAAFNDLGVIVQQITDDQGRFDFNVSPVFLNYQLRVTAEGFQMVTVGAGASRIQLSISPRSESVRVVGSALDVPSSQQGTSVSVITSQEIRQRNEGQAVDLMRELPGLVFSQSGGRGAVADLFVRGGDSKYNLVQLNGIPINTFFQGGLFDFSAIPSDFLSEIDVARGPQSAVYGSYAIGSVTNFVTRSPENGPALDILAEGGTHDENRFALSGSDLVHGWGVAGSLSSLEGNGRVPNEDFRNQNIFLSAEHRWYTQSLFAFGNFNSNEAGEPGPYGSNPLGLYSGLDLISREKNNVSTYGFHYQWDVADRFRQDITAGFFLNNSLYRSPFGDSFNKDIRGYAEARETFKVTSWWTLAGGFVFDREEMKNTYVTDNSFRNFPLRRDNEGIYLDNHLTYMRRLFLNVGAREEIYQMPDVPAFTVSFGSRPAFPARTYTRLNPKISGAYLLPGNARIHASFGTGIRPPGGSDLAFTDNPSLRPEHTESYDIGVEQQFWSGRASIDGTWFRNRYKDLIVGLGGNLATISAFQTDNVANALAKGIEMSAHVRPANWILLSANYTWLESEVLSLNGGIGLVQQDFYLGQPLLRRPKQSGSALATVHHNRIDANLYAYTRSRTLDVEPNFGASAGLYWDPSYTFAGININYRVRGNLTAYVNLRNALNRRYEEIYGFPAPLLNVVAGLKWSLARSR